MKKHFVCLLLLICMSLGATLAFAENKILDELTGQVWVHSTMNDKSALIYGVECAIAIEYATAEHIAQKEGKPTDKESIVRSLTSFPRNWIHAFEGSDRKSIVNAIDAWYANNSDQLQRPVFGVLWYEIIAPRIAEKK